MHGDLARYAVANARGRAMLSSSLGLGAMSQWYALPDVSAMLEALSHTVYGRARSPEQSLETTLAGRVAAIGSMLLETLREREASFFRLYLLRQEMENLKMVIRAVHRGLVWAEVAGLIVDLPDIATLEPRALVGAHDLRDVLERVRATPYARPLAAAFHRLDSAGPFALETALEIDYYERLWLAAGALEPADAERVRHLLGILFDLLNLGWIARYRQVFGLAPEEVLNYVLREGKWLDFERRRALVENSDRPWEGALAGTPYAAVLRQAPDGEHEGAWVALWRLLAREAHRNLAGYPFHAGVPLGVLLTAEIETRDLRVLLAAKRLGMPLGTALDRVATVRN